MNILLLGHIRALFQIRPRAKRSVGVTRDDQRSRGPVSALSGDGLDMVGQVVQEGARERIPGMWSVQQQDADVS